MMKKMLTMLLALAMMLSTACAMADGIQLYKVEGGTETEKPLDLDSETSTYQAQLRSGGVYRLTGKVGGAIKLSKASDDSGTEPVTLTLDGVEITSKGTALRIDHSSDVNLILKETNLLAAAGNGLHTNGSVSISAADASGGTLNVTAGSDGIYSLTGDVKISGGTVKVLQAAGNGICSPKGNVTISGGTVNVRAIRDGIYSLTGDVKISGGTVNVTATSNGIRSSGGVTILGGTLEVTAGSDGISSSAGVTISGGEVNVTQSGGDGISSSAGVTISGGTVNVTQSGGNGIFSPTGDVTISGGTVNVTADGNGIFSPAGVVISRGRVEVQSGGCGITGDFTGDVTISGGTVIAESTGDSGFGIGGDHVTISGDDTSVRASGYDGIGAADDVKISGGTVVAQSNGLGEGNFSGGIHSDRGDVTISGGTVTAKATGETGRGILSIQGNVTISDGDVRIMGRVKSIHAFAGLKVDDKLHSMGRYDGTTDWTPAAPEHVGGYQWAWFAPGVPVSFKLGGGAKTVRVPGNGTWLMPQPEMLGLTVPQGLAYTGVWMHNGAQYPIGARAPRISGGETFTMETVAVAAADLPKTGDPSMLGAWAALLGASAMGLKKMKKKS